MYNSPLRYPGGKNKLSAFVAKICIDNKINGHYVEPYAGGSAVALFLLFEKFVKEITINDKDKSIYAFWYSALNYTEELCSLIESTPVDIKNWREQKSIQEQKETIDLLTLGFSTLFLNRTNRSGIINGGPIGGIEQKSDYKIDCRFNKQDLILRIKKIGASTANIRLLNMDAVELIDKIEGESKNTNMIFYFDPPYYLKASSLYLNHYKKNDHLEVSERIKNIESIQWIVSYDNVPEINKLYDGYRVKEYSFFHNAYESRIGKEVLFFSSKLKLPNIKNWEPLAFKKKRLKAGMKITYKPS